jgi:hypothetical protein
MGRFPIASSPPLVHIFFTGVLLRPTKSNGCQWDGLGCNASEATEAAGAIGSALSRSQPYVAVAAIVAGPAMSSLEKPDAAGTAELFVHGQSTVFQLVKRQDSFTPTWDARWLSVVLDPSVRLHVKLLDKDLQFDDDIGTFELSHDSLQAAYAQQAVLQVPVARQTNNQVLFAGISVIAAH